MTLLRRARTSYPAVSILTILKRNYRRRDVLGDGGLGDGTAPLLQHGFAQPLDRSGSRSEVVSVV
jgi:hypothetical protein